MRQMGVVCEREGCRVERNDNTLYVTEEETEPGGDPAVNTAVVLHRLVLEYDQKHTKAEKNIYILERFDFLCIQNDAYKQGSSTCEYFKSKKTIGNHHKSYNNFQEILQNLKIFNSQLYDNGQKQTFLVCGAGASNSPPDMFKDMHLNSPEH